MNVFLFPTPQTDRASVFTILRKYKLRLTVYFTFQSARANFKLSYYFAKQKYIFTTSKSCK